MDFIDGLPHLGRYNSILVVVDKLSRYAHFIGLSHPYTASTVAVACMENVHKLHDLLMSTHASILVDSVGPPSAEVCRTAASFP
jgi:hypothetical protein